MQKRSVSLVIPLFNNARTAVNQLEQCYRQLAKTATKFEIILCDDASSDNSAEIIKKFAQSHSGVHTLFHRKNLGIAPTLRQLYGLAKYDYTVLFSVDGEWNPNDVGKLIAKVNSTQADIVIGQRLHKKYTFLRKTISYIYNLLPQLLFGVTTYDTGSIKIFKSAVYKNTKLLSPSVFFEGELLIRAQQQHLKISQIPVEHLRKNMRTKSGVNFRSTQAAVLDLCRFWLQSLQGNPETSQRILLSGILLMVGLSFGYFGLTTPRPVSDDYNLPLAQNIISGKFLTINSTNPYLYFPGSSNAILSLLIFLHLPVNIFGTLGWLALLITCYLLARTFKLSNFLSLLFTGAFGTTISVVRTIADQSIDKWLAVWFICAFILLEKAKPTMKFAVLLGLSTGFLIGSKYSGPLFAIPLVIIYIKNLWKNLNIKRSLVFIFCVFISGGFWYGRNWVLKGNPMYPANLPFFSGMPGYTQQDWMLWKIPLLYPSGIVDLFNAFISEYGVWIFAPLSIFVLKIHKLKLLIISTLAVALLLPITTPYKIPLFHIISDMRYIYIPMLFSLLGVFILVQKFNYAKPLAIVVLLSAIPSFAFVPFYPKLFILGIFIMAMWWGRLPGEANSVRP